MKATHVQNTIIKQFKIIRKRHQVIRFYSNGPFTNGIFQEVTAEDYEVTVVKTYNFFIVPKKENNHSLSNKLTDSFRTLPKG